MLETLTAAILREFLADYVEPLDAEQISTGFFGGKSAEILRRRRR